MTRDPTHLVAHPGDSRSICGIKDPLPVVAAEHAQAHIDGYGMEVCPLCAGQGPLDLPSLIPAKPVAHRCRSCEAPVRWVRTRGKGALMPVDLEPDPDGIVEVFADDTATVHVGTPLMLEGVMHTSHFATCPQADQWRTK